MKGVAGVPPQALSIKHSAHFVLALSAVAVALFFSFLIATRYSAHFVLALSILALFHPIAVNSAGLE